VLVIFSLIMGLLVGRQPSAIGSQLKSIVKMIYEIKSQPQQKCFDDLVQSFHCSGLG
jgi:hypothetical protein